MSNYDSMPFLKGFFKDPASVQIVYIPQARPTHDCEYCKKKVHHRTTEHYWHCTTCYTQKADHPTDRCPRNRPTFHCDHCKNTVRHKTTEHYWHCTT